MYYQFMAHVKLHFFFSNKCVYNIYRFSTDDDLRVVLHSSLYNTYFLPFIFYGFGLMLEIVPAKSVLFISNHNKSYLMTLKI